MAQNKPLQRWFSTAEAAAYVGKSRSYLEHARTQSGVCKDVTGPAYRRVGGRVMYERCDLDAWLEQFPKARTVAEELHHTGKRGVA